MRVVRALGLALAATMLLLAPATGQSPGFCDVTDRAYFQTMAPMLEGTWQLEAVAGHTVYRGETMTMPVGEFPPLPPTTLTFDEEHAHLVMSSEGLPAPLPLTWEEGRTLFPDAESQMPPIGTSEEDLNMQAGCIDGGLPVLSATGQFPFADGLKEDAYRLIVIDDNTIHGVIRSYSTYNGSPMFGRMEITLTR